MIKERKNYLKFAKKNAKGFLSYGADFGSVE
jgi:hypothetical protein